MRQSVYNFQQWTIEVLCSLFVGEFVVTGAGFGPCGQLSSRVISFYLFISISLLSFSFLPHSPSLRPSSLVTLMLLSLSPVLPSVCKLAHSTQNSLISTSPSHVHLPRRVSSCLVARNWRRPGSRLRKLKPRSLLRPK